MMGASNSSLRPLRLCASFSTAGPRLCLGPTPRRTLSANRPTSHAGVAMAAILASGGRSPQERGFESETRTSGRGFESETRTSRTSRCLRFCASFTICCAIAAVGTPSSAQTPDEFQIAWHAVTGGGGFISSGGFSMMTAIGQPAASTLSDGEFSMTGGFLPAAENTTFDCNVNDLLDSLDIAYGKSQDCDANGAPDECQEDCNTNGVADPCDIAGPDPFSEDLNGNGIPDECESCLPPALMEARSVATHDTGEFYVALDLSNNPAVRTTEPRSTGVRVMDFVFDQPLVGGSVTVTPGGVEVPMTLLDDGSRGRVDLGASLPNAGVYRLTIQGSSGPACDVAAEICVAALVGDFNGDGRVTAADKAELTGFVFQPVSQANAKYDVSVGDGPTIAVSDVGFWTGFFGTSVVDVPCP